MHESGPRIPPVNPVAFTPEQKALVGDWSAMNFATVIVEHPGLYRALMPLIAKLISGSDLPPRDREVLVLRTLALCDEVYEYNHHVLIARGAGMTDAEIEAAATGGADLAAFDRTLVNAAEELARDRRVSDETWRALDLRYSPAQLMEVVSLVGGYTLMAMLTKSFGIELEDPETFAGFGRLRTYT
jgi:4-carboxymuconolactone decarboxylase